MKTILLPVAIAVTSLFSLPSVEAQEKSFGGFKPNYKFTLRVQNVVSIKSQGLVVQPVKAPIPKGLPKYKKGQKVKFKIGNKGELIAKGTNLPFSADAGSANVYTTVTTGKNAKTYTGTIAKSKNKATAATLAYLQYSGSPFSMKTYSLTYTLR